MFIERIDELKAQKVIELSDEDDVLDMHHLDLSTKSFYNQLQYNYRKLIKYFSIQSKNLEIRSSYLFPMLKKLHNKIIVLQFVFRGTATVEWFLAKTIEYFFGRWRCLVYIRFDNTNISIEIHLINPFRKGQIDLLSITF